MPFTVVGTTTSGDMKLVKHNYEYTIFLAVKSVVTSY